MKPKTVQILKHSTSYKQQEMAKIDDIQDELWRFTPELKKGKGFEVPANYFEQLPDLVLAKAQEVEAAELAPKQQGSSFDSFLERLVLFLQPRHIMAATAIALVLMAFIYLMPLTSKRYEPIALEELRQEEVIRYIQDNLEEFEEDLMLLELEYTAEN